MEKVVLAYSGGMDTSVILHWLLSVRQLDVYVYIANVGQKEDFDAVATRAISLGAKKDNIYIVDIRDELIENYYCKAAKAGAIYESYYLMGTPICRPAIARKQIEIARNVKARYVSHGCTHKGNDQYRFELAYYSLNPDIEVIAPWRQWDIKGRSGLLSYAKEYGIDWLSKREYSRDENILHLTAEGEELEDSWCAPNEDAWRWIVCPTKAPDRVSEVTISFHQGIPVAIDGVRKTPRLILEDLNQLGAKNGIGRLDIVDSRVTGLKSRGLFEAPGATIWRRAHKAIESITLTREQIHLSSELSLRYSIKIYEGFWYSPEMKSYESFFETIQEYVSGEVRLSIYKGNVEVVGVKSPYSLYDSQRSSFDSTLGIKNSSSEGMIEILVEEAKNYYRTRGNYRPEERV